MRRSPGGGRTGRRKALPSVGLAAVLLLGGCGPEGPSSPAGSPGQSPESPTTSVRDIEVTVDGRTISGHCSGSMDGGPTAVLVQGNGGNQYQLSGLERHLAERTLVCAYDRAGVGESDPPPQRPRPVTEVVAEMEGFLEEADIEPPYFLVGVSAGGVVAFMYAQAHPKDVSGFVVVNPMPPPFSADIEQARKVFSKKELREVELPDFLGENPEGITFTDNDSLLTDDLPPTMPYAVLFDEDCGGNTEFCARILQYLPGLMKDLSTVGAGGRFQWVKGAGHDIHVTRPELALQTIDEVWEEASS